MASRFFSLILTLPGMQHLSRDAYETVGVTDDVRARLRALTCASARSSRIRRGDVTEWGPNDKNVVLVVRGRRAYGLPD